MNDLRKELLIKPIAGNIIHLFLTILIENIFGYD